MRKSNKSIVKSLGFERLVLKLKNQQNVNNFATKTPILPLISFSNLYICVLDKKQIFYYILL
ncbi:MAG: hypothetical protein RLZZ540_72 [Bacteroidota bacterium]